MNWLKKLLDRIFIEGLSGMAHGLFATLIVGTIIQQIGILIGGQTGNMLCAVGKMAAALTGAGIGVGVAYRLKASSLVVLSAATAGMVGGFASKLLAGNVLGDGSVILTGPGEPLGAFIAAYIGIEIGQVLSGKTKIDILLTPIVTVGVGSAAGLLVGPAISEFMNRIGGLINWGTELQPLIMGIVVSVLMGMALTLPISSAALGVILNLNGLAAGVASFRENKVGGLLAQGIGTSMLQIPNIVRNPLIWIPPILSSAVLGPIATIVLKMTNNATGAGMGTAGLVGPIMTWQTMSVSEPATIVLMKIFVIQIILPAIVTAVIAEFMRKKKWIKQGDMKLEL